MPISYNLNLTVNCTLEHIAVEVAHCEDSMKFVKKKEREDMSHPITVISVPTRSRPKGSL